VSARAAPIEQAAPPRLGTYWTPDGIDIAEVRSTWREGVVVRWRERRQSRRCIYTPLAEFYTSFNRHVAPFDPRTCRDRYADRD
jgi:hypothetical protein